MSTNRDRVLELSVWSLSSRIGDCPALVPRLSPDIGQSRSAVTRWRSNNYSCADNIEPRRVCHVDHLIDIIDLIVLIVIFDMADMARHDNQFALTPIWVVLVECFLDAIVIALFNFSV